MEYAIPLTTIQKVKKKHSTCEGTVFLNKSLVYFGSRLPSRQSNYEEIDMRFNLSLVFTVLSVLAFLFYEEPVGAKLPNGCNAYQKLEVPAPSTDILKEGESQKVLVTCFEIFEWDSANSKPGARIAALHYQVIADRAYTDPSTGVQKIVFGGFPRRTPEDVALIQRLAASPQRSFYGTASNYWYPGRVSGLVNMTFNNTGGVEIILD